MKRRIMFILLSLVAGAIVNVGVAWGLATWKIDFTAADVQYVQPLRWLGSAPSTWPEPMAKGHVAGIGRKKDFRSGIGHGTSSKPSFFQEEEFATGLPMRGLRLGSLLSYEQQQLMSQRVYVHALDGRIIGFPTQRFPLRPIWPGFAINTVFYAFILWLLFALGGTPFALRRRRRIKRGLCPKCAYPVGTWGGAVCTECGAAVVKQKPETQKAEIA